MSTRQKIFSTFLLPTLILLISANSSPAENTPDHLKLTESSLFSISKSNEEFSLRKNYEVEIKKINTPFFELEKRGKKLNFQETARNPRIDEIKGEISRLKKKKTGSIIAAIGLAGLGGFLFYTFATFEESERVTQVTEEGGRGLTSGHRGYSLGGALACFAVTAGFINDVVKKSKNIKSYEKEIRKLAEAQKK